MYRHAPLDFMEQPSLERSRFSANPNIFHILWTPKFYTVFTRTHHVPLLRVGWIQCTPSHQFALRSTSALILSSHLRLCVPIGLFLSGFPTKRLCAFFFSPMRATWPAHVIFLDLITTNIWLGMQNKNFLVWCNKLKNYIRINILLKVYFGGLYYLQPGVRKSWGPLQICLIGDVTFWKYI